MKEEIMVERDRVKNLLKANNYSEKELDLITDFFLNNKKYKETPLEDKETLEKKGKLEKLYIDLIKKEQEKFLEHQDIKKMIVMVSYAEISKIGNILFELPIEKSMRIFPNLDVIYLLYTSGTEEDFEHIKDKFKKNFELKRVEIIGKKVENTLESIYPYLKELVREGKISKNDTVLDLTTGMKISGIALYKLAVERGIKIINWKEEFLALPKNSDGKGSGNVRIPFSICLEVLKEPIRESSRNYERVNSALKNKEYSLVTNLFEVIGDEDKAFLFENIEKAPGGQKCFRRCYFLLYCVISVLCHGDSLLEEGCHGTDHILRILCAAGLVGGVHRKLGAANINGIHGHLGV